MASTNIPPDITLLELATKLTFCPDVSESTKTASVMTAAIVQASADDDSERFARLMATAFKDPEVLIKIVSLLAEVVATHEAARA